VLTDTHCHLTYAPDGARDAVAAARAAGVTTLVTVGTDLASSAECARLAAGTDGVFAAVGIHPNDAVEATDHVLARIEELAAHPRVVALGETGLDWFREGAPRVRQEESFRAHIRMARDLDRAVVVHDRDAHDDVVRVLLDERPLPRTVFHCFSGGPDLVEVCAEQGWFMSFAGNVTFRNAAPLQAAAAAVPDHLLLVETDAPFLTPHPHRGRPNHPGMVAVTAAFLAELRGVEVEALAATTSANAATAFGLPSAGAGAGGWAGTTGTSPDRA
jgi:TatD DNase family protein